MLEDTFDAVPIIVFFVSVIGAVAVDSCLQPRCRIDEKEGIINEMFVAEFREEHLGDPLISHRREFDV